MRRLGARVRADVGEGKGKWKVDIEIWKSRLE
jgi:hypothetical protein